MDKKIKIAVESFKKDPSSVKFNFLTNGEKMTGFALLFDGSYYVYKNQCQHLPVELDWEENEFFDEDNKFIVCATHGANYKFIILIKKFIFLPVYANIFQLT